MNKIIKKHEDKGLIKQIYDANIDPEVQLMSTTNAE